MRARPARRPLARGALRVSLALGAAVVACQRAAPPKDVADVRAGDVAVTAEGAPHDSIVPRGAPGEPASRFPAPSRRVASIVAPRWSTEDDRDDAGEAERVMELLRVRAGMAVADVGAGDGYYSVRLAERVGPAGRVYAQDIVARYLALLRERVAGGRVPNVILALGEPHDPRLPRASVDLALLVHMYHEIEQPFGLLYNLHPSLRPGARVAVLDLERATQRHGTPIALLRCELEAMGYRHERTHDTAPGEYVAVFVPPPNDSALTAPDAVAARLAALGCVERAAPAGGR